MSDSTDKARQFINSSLSGEDPDGDEGGDGGLSEKADDPLAELSDRYEHLSEDEILDILDNAEEAADGDSEVVPQKALVAEKAMATARSINAMRAMRAGVGQKAEWIPYSGPQGGEGWKNPESGEVHYGSDPPGETVDPDEISDEDLEDFAESEGIDAEPDEIREQLREELGQREGGGDGGSGGGLDDVLSSGDTGELSEDDIMEGAEETFSGDYDESDKQDFEDVLWSNGMSDERASEIADAAEEELGGGGDGRGSGGGPGGSNIDFPDSAETTQVGETTINAAFTGPFEDMGMDEEQARQAAANATHEADDGGWVSEEDLGRSIADAMGTDPDDQQVRDMVNEMTNLSEQFNVEGDPMSGGFAPRDNVTGGSGGEVDDERMNEMISDAYSDNDVEDRGGFAEDVMNNLGLDSRAAPPEGTTEEEVQGAIDEALEDRSDDDSGGGDGGGRPGQDQLSEELSDYMPGQSERVTNELAFQLSRGEGPITEADVEDAVDIAGPGGPDNDLLVDQVSAAVDAERDDEKSKSKAFIEESLEGLKGGD